MPKRLSRVFSSTTIQKHQFFCTKPSLCSNSYIHTWVLEKTIALTIQTFVGKVMSVLFNMLSRFVIAFLPRSKRLLISWLRSPSSVILGPKKIKTRKFPSQVAWLSSEMRRMCWEVGRGAAECCGLITWEGFETLKVMYKRGIINSLEVQWLGLSTFTSLDPGFSPWLGN